MTHLVANYPDPQAFNLALQSMLARNVEYFEVQLPFTHPVADGPVIYEANQKSLKFDNSLEDIVNLVGETKLKTVSKTKLILMSYLTPLVNYGFENLINLLTKNGFFSLIVPDLTVGTPEYLTLSKLSKDSGLQLTPVISPITTQFRLKKILNFIDPGSLVYYTIRKGQTGAVSSLDSSEVLERLNFIKENLSQYKVAVGFGIKSKEQVDFLNSYGYTAVIGSELVRRLTASYKDGGGISQTVDSFLTEVGVD